MRNILRLAFVTWLSLGAVACSSGDFERFISAGRFVSDSKVSPAAIASGLSAFRAVEITATEYLGLPRCTGAAMLCRSPAASKEIIRAVRSGRIARDSLKAFVRAHPDELGPSGLFDALNASIGTLEGVYAAYRIK